MSKTNAKTEFQDHVKWVQSGYKKKVLCAKVWTERDYEYDEYNKVEIVALNEYILPIGWDEEDMVVFLEKLNFFYDSGYGGQNLYGIIWYDDMSWSDRGEYDGSEWWSYQTIPEIPFECFKRTTTNNDAKEDDTTGNTGDLRVCEGTQGGEDKVPAHRLPQDR